jgi:hypothetical protein
MDMQDMLKRYYFRDMWVMLAAKPVVSMGLVIGELVRAMPPTALNVAVSMAQVQRQANK